MFLLLLAGLVSLPREPYLAAAIDGASSTRIFWQVTFPLMAPISIGAIIIRLIEASKIMDTVYVMTSGGPVTATETPSYYIYIRGLRDFQVGYSAALSLAYLVIMIITLTIIAKFLTRFWSERTTDMGRTYNIMKYLCLLAWTTFVVFPFLWALSTSFKDANAITSGARYIP